MKSLLLALLSLGLVDTARARLGETEAELTQRFGQPKSRNPNLISADGRMFELGILLHFYPEEWAVGALLIDGRVAHETYTKRGKWTDDQIKAVLTANSQGDTGKFERVSPLVASRFRRRVAEQTTPEFLTGFTGLKAGISRIGRTGLNPDSGRRRRSRAG